MKKILVLIRHGRAIEPEDFSKSDFERPLIKKGEDEVGDISKLLHKWKYKPDIIISSSAKRCIQTAKILAKKCKYKKQNIKLSKDLYESNYQSYIKNIQNIPEDNKVVFLSGHNPVITQVASLICGCSLPSMEKGSIAIIRFEKDTLWASIEKGTGELLAYISPKSI